MPESTKESEVLFYIVPTLCDIHKKMAKTRHYN